MLMLKFWKKNKNTDQTAVLRQKVTKQSISNAYNKRSTEIESLRKYDRGEKTINAPDIRAAVRSL